MNAIQFVYFSVQNTRIKLKAINYAYRELSPLKDTQNTDNSCDQYYFSLKKFHSQIFH